MKTLVLPLTLLFIPSLVHALTFEIEQYRIELPGYTERIGSSNNSIAQKRALSPERDIIFNAGSFKHPKATLEMHVASMLIVSCPNPEDFKKHVRILSLSDETIAKVRAASADALAKHDPETSALRSFEKVQIAGHTGYHCLIESFDTKIWTQTFFLPGKEDGAIVQISLGGEAKSVRDKEAFKNFIQPRKP